MPASKVTTRAVALVMAVSVGGSGVAPQGSRCCSAEEIVNAKTVASCCCSKVAKQPANEKSCCNRPGEPAQELRQGCGCKSGDSQPAVPSDQRQPSGLKQLGESMLFLSATVVHSYTAGVEQIGTLIQTSLPDLRERPLRVLHCSWLI